MSVEHEALKKEKDAASKKRLQIDLKSNQCALAENLLLFPVLATYSNSANNYIVPKRGKNEYRE